MFPTFRLAVSWVHTWAGLVTGYLLMVVFFFGTLAIFDHEIDRWAIPETRFTTAAMPSWAEVIGPAFDRLEPSAEQLAKLPARPDKPVLRLDFAQVHRMRRSPLLALYTDFVAVYPDGKTEHLDGPFALIDPRSGENVAASGLPIGTDFFYPMHLHLHLESVLGGIGYWLVGLAAMGMLVALVTGVVIHRKLFAELFTFRAWKSAPRSHLDLHDLTGVLGLPFHFLFALTGLVVFAEIYLPIEPVTEPLHALHRESPPRPKRERAGHDAPLASVDAMMRESAQAWGSLDDVAVLFLHHPGDQNAIVSVYRDYPKNGMSLLREGFHFDGASGALLAPEAPPSKTAAALDFLVAVHLQPFEAWALHWLYFFGGLAGCACLVTGLILFVRKRRRKHPGGARWADAFSVATVTGMVVACGVLLVANRACPTHPKVQVAAFWLAWLATFVHGFVRNAVAWREQCWAIAGLGITAVVLDAVTTGDHLVRTLFTHRYLPVAGVDLALLATAGVAIVAARRLRRQELAHAE